MQPPLVLAKQPVRTKDGSLVSSSSSQEFYQDMANESELEEMATSSKNPTKPSRSQKKKATKARKKEAADAKKREEAEKAKSN